MTTQAKTPIKPAEKTTTTKTSPVRTTNKPRAPVKSATKPAKKLAVAKKTPAIKAASAKTAANKKPQKVKVIRDSFTMPKVDYAKIDSLKKTCLAAGVHIKKSELLRAGLGVLTTMPTNKLIEIVKSIESVKTGRPAKHKEK